MQLARAQLEAFDRDGFLVFPRLLAQEEIDILLSETERVSRVEADGIFREGDDQQAKSLFRLHEPDGATASPAFRQLARSPRCLGLAQQVLADDALYLHHSKVNMKAAIQGSTWPWHQDFMSWKLDGIERPNMVTVLVMLHEATPINGCLYFIPGSHKLNRLDPYYDTSTAYRLWAADTKTMRKAMALYPEPVSVTGAAGTAVVFHCNLLHASGHNLSPIDRWHAFMCFNTVANHPQPVEDPRPDYVRSTNWNKLVLGDNSPISNAAAG